MPYCRTVYHLKRWKIMFFPCMIVLLFYLLSQFKCFQLHSVLSTRASIKHFPELGCLDQVAVPMPHASSQVCIAGLQIHFLPLKQCSMFFNSETVLFLFLLKLTPCQRYLFLSCSRVLWLNYDTTWWVCEDFFISHQGIRAGKSHILQQDISFVCMVEGI